MTIHIIYLKDHGGHKKGGGYNVKRKHGVHLIQEGIAVPYTVAKEMELAEKNKKVEAEKKAAAEKAKQKAEKKKEPKIEKAASKAFTKRNKAMIEE